MRFLIVLLSLLGFAVGGEIYAVLVAGSNGYFNYRHQADVCHAYHMLTNHNVKPENIITFVFDDIAQNYLNPFKGKLFNQPDGQDVYAGVPFDYTGYDVTPENFLAVLTGDAKGVKGGNGRVLKSTNKDKVFIYYADHGAPSLLAFPYDVMTVRDLNSALQSMYDKKMYNELVFYMEACFSGSMFENVLPKNLSILAVTSANAVEESWACYCDIPNFEHTCLSDYFTTSWLQDSDSKDLSKETLQSQYTIIKTKTNVSNVLQFGDLSISKEVVANFQGHSKSRSSSNSRHQPENFERWSSREVPLKSLESQLKRASDPVKRVKLARELELMKMKRKYLDEHTHELVSKLISDVATREQVITNTPTKIEQLECHDRVVKTYSTECFNLGQNSYALNAVGPLANLCELGMPTDRIVQAIKSHCATKNVHMHDII
ncbi:hypothetical protein M3Y94_00029300 [Aphelenchoides besseyi]|nr:hypothetical protein M3Y94_00029300 [Aphelenchoides besseyi]KAI6218564.1 Legumain [Aphelenchoides besseyi]